MVKANTDPEAKAGQRDRAKQEVAVNQQRLTHNEDRLSTLMLKASN